MARLQPGGSPEPYEFLGSQPISALICALVPPAFQQDWFDTLRDIIQLSTSEDPR